MALDLTLSPIYRIGGQEIANLPGLIAINPPQNAARGRDKDRLVVYLLLTGNSTFSSSEYMQLAVDAANVFHQTSGALTSALRSAAETVNNTLLERNMSTSSQGQYAVGWVTLAALRDSQCTFLLSGPMHVHWFGQNEARHIHEPATSGKGLGVHPTGSFHYAQINLSAGDRLLFYGRAPSAWDSTLDDPSPSSMDALRRRLISLTSADLNAVLIQASDGAGVLNLIKGNESAAPSASPATESLPRPEEAQPTPEPEPAPPSHVVQPSAYSIPPQREENLPAEQPKPQNNSVSVAGSPRSGAREFPASIPRIKPQTQPTPSEPVLEETIAEPEPVTPEAVEVKEVKKERPVRDFKPRISVRREPSARARQTAKALATGIRSTRQASAAIGDRFRNFLPRLLPNTDSTEPLAPSNATMIFMAILIPLMVVTIVSVVYLRYGRSQQYETYLLQAQEMKAQALTLTNPVEQRIAWENVLLNVDIAESHRETSETILLREEANANLDVLLGITRMQFNPVFSSNLNIEISRMAASELDLFMLNAATGEVLRAELVDGRSFQLDTNFNCKPGVYGDYTVGPLVDILAMPGLNSINATLLGIDATGNLLYCAPGLVARAIPLPPPDTNWGRVTSFTLDGGNLYVLDAPSRALWVYTGKDYTFSDRPYFFFGGQTPEKQDVIDLVIAGDDLFMLHADGHVSTCSYSRIESVPTRCQDPTPLINPFTAYQDVDLFGNAHFTQILFTAPPDPSVLLLDADSQGVLRFAPHTLELQNQFRPTTGSGNPIPSGPVGAVAVGPNHVLYLAVNGQVYFATGMP